MARRRPRDNVAFEKFTIRVLNRRGEPGDLLGSVPNWYDVQLANSTQGFVRNTARPALAGGAAFPWRHCSWWQRTPLPRDRTSVRWPMALTLLGCMTYEIKKTQHVAERRLSPRTTVTVLRLPCPVAGRLR